MIDFSIALLIENYIMNYCTAIETMMSEEKKALHKNYHDNYYGFPLHDDNELFCRLVMEINQAGLSWETILKKGSILQESLQQLRYQRSCSIHRSRQRKAFG